MCRLLNPSELHTVWWKTY